MSTPNSYALTVDASRQNLVRIGFTAILLGYLMVWLPGEVAGLSFLGLEIGEWVKFLPRVRSGQIAADRNLFYLPPITLGLMMALWTFTWPNQRWQSWAMRGLAVGVAMLAFPSIEVILNEASDQWLLRVVLIMFVAIVAISAPLWNRLPRDLGLTIGWSAMLALSLAGLILPLWAYLVVRPIVVSLFATEVGFGPGLWLNTIGHLLVAVATLTLIRELRRLKREQVT